MVVDATLTAAHAGTPAQPTAVAVRLMMHRKVALFGCWLPWNPDPLLITESMAEHASPGQPTRRIEIRSTRPRRLRWVAPFFNRKGYDSRGGLMPSGSVHKFAPGARAGTLEHGAALQAINAVDEKIHPISTGGGHF